MPRILYKYLDIVGAKCMIGNRNLQFTNASQLILLIVILN